MPFETFRRDVLNDVLGMTAGSSYSPGGATPYPGKGRFEGRMGWTRHLNNPPGPAMSGERAGELPEGEGKPEQLPMLMSAREITSKFQPLDADRDEAYDPREGEPTGRAETTAGHPNPRITTNDRNAAFLKGAPGSATHYRDIGQTETHEQMMSRKLDESKLPWADYREVHHGGSAKSPLRTPDFEDIVDSPTAPQHQTGHTGTWEYDIDEYAGKKISEHYMQQNKEGSLFTDLQKAMRPKAFNYKYGVERPAGEGFTGLVHLSHQFGEQGKPQMAGAHHRIAALEQIAPDRLLPVIHHENVIQARLPENTQHHPYS